MLDGRAGAEAKGTASPSGRRPISSSGRLRNKRLIGVQHDQQQQSESPSRRYANRLSMIIDCTPRAAA